MLKVQVQILGRLAVVYLLATAAAAGQTASLALSALTGVAGSGLNLTLSSSGNPPAALQWTFTYEPGTLYALNVELGPSAISAAKTITCAAGSGVLTCLLAGVNQTPIADGIVAIVNVTPVAGITGLIPIGISGIVGASAAGARVPLVGTGGSIISGGGTGNMTGGSAPSNGTGNMTAGSGTSPGSGTGGTTGGGSVTSAGTVGGAAIGISGITCVPAVLTSGAATTCTVSLSTPATSDSSVFLSSNNPTLNVPSSVTVGAGNDSASFTASAGIFGAEQAAAVTGTLNSKSLSTILVLAGTATLQNLPTETSPTISGIPAGVLDGGSYTAGVAHGSIFVIKGTNLSPAGVVQAASYPLSTSLNGVTITLTPAGGEAPISAYMLYTYSVNSTNQLAAILPSGAAPGLYQVAVTNNGVTGLTVPVRVFDRKFELITADSSGSGAAAVQIQDTTGNYFYNRFTTGQAGNSGAVSYTPAHPGDFVVAYGTGLGPIQGSDNSPPGAVDLSGEVKVQVLVGGKTLAPSYAGRSANYPGLDQVNVQLPPDVLTGCTVSFQVRVAGQLSNPATIAVAPVGGSTCSPAPFSADVLARLDQGGGLVVGNFLLSQMASTITEAGGSSLQGRNESALGAFTRYTGFQLGSATALLNPPGSCQVFQTAGDANQLMFGPVGTNLDAGTLLLNGPNIPDQSFAEDPASQYYGLSLGILPVLPGGLYLPAGFPSFTNPPLITPGIYQLANSGGRDVGRFLATTTVGQPPAFLAPLPQSIDRTQNLIVSWSSANAGDLVAIAGASGTVVGGTGDHPIYQAGTFLCVAVAAAGSITVPSAVLQQLPATPAENGIGYVQVSSWPQPAAGNGMFTAPLQTGTSIDSGIFLGRTGVFSTTSYQ